MRLFTLEPGAESSIHSHPWPHWFVCIKGESHFLIGKERVPLEFGTWLHIPVGMHHNFGNTGNGEPMGLCSVPPEGDVNPLIGCRVHKKRLEAVASSRFSLSKNPCLKQRPFVSQGEYEGAGAPSF